LDKTSITAYLKPRVLKQILQRNSSLFEVPLVLLDSAGRVLVETTVREHPSFEKDSGTTLPIMIRGTLFGSLLGYETGYIRGERFHLLLENVVEQISELIISEMKLDSMSEELLHNYKVLNLFYNVSNSLVNILNVRKVCNIILERIVATIGLSKASVLLLDESRKHLTVVAHHGLPDEEVEGALFDLEESVCREAIAMAKPLFIQNIDHYPGLKMRSRGHYRFNSFISVPILKIGQGSNQEVLGVINVADKLSGDPFYSGDMKLIIALTSLAAMSIQNARNFETVERSKEEWESTFDAITDTVAILDMNYRLLRVNQAYQSLNGWDKEFLIHKTCYRVFYHLDSPCQGCPAGRTMRTGEPSYAEKKIGARIFRQWTYPVRNETGKISSVVIYSRDVTNLKRLKERLIQSERMASIGQIAAGVAHEIRNPLGSIVTAVEVLSSAGGSDEENLYTLTEVIQVEAKRLNDIISEFLLYAAPQQLKLRENNLNRVIREVLRMIRPEAEKEGKRIEVRLDDRVEPSLFDEAKIKQVIWNIVLNGIQSMGSGGVLFVSTRWTEERVEFRVRDQGPGIRNEDRARIFDPFFTTKATGTGLGLSIVNRIIGDHHGEVEIQSQPGIGSEFIVSLPLKGKREPAPENPVRVMDV